MKEIIINENDSGQRLDKFLTKFMPSLPQSMLYKGLRKNCVRINGKHVKDGSIKLRRGDALALYFKDEFFPSAPEFKKTDYDLDIAYEDENIIVINKRIGKTVHSSEKEEATLIDEVKSLLFDRGEYKPEREHSFSPALCSRLDRNTGGLITCAKNAAALRTMNEIIRSRRITKKYICLCEGKFASQHEILRGYLVRSDKQVSVYPEPTENAKEIITEYSVLCEREKHTLVEITLHTGRTHQIRAHMAYIGHPLAGDSKYGARIPCAFAYQALFCHSLTFADDADSGILSYLNGKTIKAQPPKELRPTQQQRR